MLPFIGRRGAIIDVIFSSKLIQNLKRSWKYFEAIETCNKSTERLHENKPNKHLTINFDYFPIAHLEDNESHYLHYWLHVLNKSIRKHQNKSFFLDFVLYYQAGSL